MLQFPYPAYKFLDFATDKHSIFCVDIRVIDDETGLYYCSSRYYDPEVGKWISPDSIEYLNPESINGFNLHVYCLNNPVMYVDSTGYSAILIGLIMGAVIGAGLGYITPQIGGTLSSFAAIL